MALLAPVFAWAQSDTDAREKVFQELHMDDPALAR